MTIENEATERRRWARGGGLSLGSRFTTNPKIIETPEFLGRLRTRDEGAITQLVRAYTKPLLRAALGFGLETELAGELVQRVWATFFGAVERFEGRSSVRTFLFGILYHKAAELRREQRREAERDPIDAVVESRFDAHGAWSRPPLDPEEFLLATERLGWLDQCLESLVSTQRAAFTLREVEGFSVDEIGVALGKNSNNIGVLLFRARNRLRECLETKAGAVREQKS